jgi:hypothetical protein
MVVGCTELAGTVACCWVVEGADEEAGTDMVREAVAVPEMEVFPAELGAGATDDGAKPGVVGCDTAGAELEFRQGSVDGRVATGAELEVRRGVADDGGITGAVGETEQGGVDDVDSGGATGCELMSKQGVVDGECTPGRPWVRLKVGCEGG